MNHSHFSGWEGPCVEIGPTACMWPSVHGGDPSITNADGSIAGGPDEHLAGFTIAFDVPWQSEGRVEGYVSVDAEHFPGRPNWTMSGSLEGGDLTLTPSVLMTIPPQPSIHGFVTDGKWVPA